MTSEYTALTKNLVTCYAYDALKRRISELRADGTVKQFVYDNWQEVQEITDGVLTASFVYDDGIDRPVAMITDDGVYYYHTDSRNNIAMVSDGSGAVVERYTYDPYGKATIKDGAGNPLAASGIDNAYLFSSRRHDEATGLYYYRNRMYSPALGRFLQRDPEWYTDSMNLMAYVGNNPVNNNDPFGLRADWETLQPDGWDPYSREVWEVSSPGPGAPSWYGYAEGTIVTGPIWGPAAIGLVVVAPAVGTTAAAWALTNPVAANEFASGVASGFVVGYSYLDEDVAQTPLTGYEALGSLAGAATGIVVRSAEDVISKFIENVFGDKENGIYKLRVEVDMRNHDWSSDTHPKKSKG